MIFFDNASTTKLCDEAVDSLIKYSVQKFYNPSSKYKEGVENFNAIQNVKKYICEILGVEFKNNIIFTGSATEASNLAIMGSVRSSFKKMLFSAGEHPSVYNTALNLKTKYPNLTIEFVNLQKNGEINYLEFENLLKTGDVDFISIMHVSNETGAINNLERISQLRKKYAPNAILHIDGVQGFGKIPTNLQKLDIDFYTLSAHKLHGPKGLGALYCKNPSKLLPQIWGGGQEYNIRSGTENLASIMAFKSALDLIDTTSQTYERLKNFANIFKTNLRILVNKNQKLKFIENENLSPYIISLSVVGLKGETLLYMCDEKGLLISTGSACSSKKSGNRILENMGYSKEEVEGSLRISFSIKTTLNEVNQGCEILANCINELYEKIKNKRR